jgi:arylsulfatase A-like enzyme
MNRISRRDVLRMSAASLALASTATRAANNTNIKPNILFIMADDMGYADVSCYGRREYSTPHIDSLAKDGMKFTHGYANSAVCTATRTALLTGRYQYRLAIGLEEPLGTRDLGVPAEHPTIASLLGKAGYGTTLIGKWHVGQLPKYGPLQNGYDHFYGFRGGGVDYFSHQYNGKDDLWDQDTLVKEHGYITDLLGDRAIKEINGYATAKKPFFISLHFSAPHWPWEGPDDEAESKRIIGRAAMSFDSGTMKTYAAMITRMDMQIGRVLDAVKRNGIDKNTIVVFTSDNGGERFAYTWPFVGRKSELLEGGLRVPTIVRWPGKVPAGITHEQITMSMDWLPTFVAVAGGKTDPNYPVDGINLLPVLTQKNAPIISREVYWRYKSHMQEALRIGDWKYLKIDENTFLFNVVADPMERANWKERDPQRYADMVAKYQAWNATMLPLDPKSSTWGFTAKDAADHIGAKNNPTAPSSHPESAND